MNRKFFALAVAALATVTLASSVNAGEVIPGAFCNKPVNGTEVVQGKCVYLRARNESREMSADLASRNATKATQQAQRTHNPADIERAQKAREFSRSFGNTFGRKK